MSCHFARILTYNINSFKANSHNFLPLFNNFEEFLDVLALFKDHKSEDNDGLHAHHNCRLGRRSGSCSIYVTDSWNSEPIGDLCISNETIESSTARVILGNEVIYVLDIYRPRCDSIGSFPCVLADILSSNKDLNTNCIVLGDLNINI